MLGDYRRRICSVTVPVKLSPEELEWLDAHTKKGERPSTFRTYYDEGPMVLSRSGFLRMLLKAAMENDAKAEASKKAEAPKKARKR